MGAIEKALNYLEACLICLTWPVEKEKAEAWLYLIEARRTLEKLSGR